jgi:ABC-type glycerol-3-phosphate transport system substrate-binding protein
VRTRLIALGAVAALLALTGCTDKGAGAAALPSEPPVVVQPAANAGGACILWDYKFIQEKIGVAFTVAAAGESADTSTCVVQTATSDYPDLALAVVESTAADGALFLSTLMPKKAKKLNGLGKAAYRLFTPAAGAVGPTIEIGWLSEAAQLQSLKYTFAPDATPDAVNAMAPKLLALAQAMDTTNG